MGGLGKIPGSRDFKAFSVRFFLHLGFRVLGGFEAPRAARRTGGSQVLSS